MMKSSLISLAGIALVGAFSCDKKSDCCTIIDTDVSIHYITKSGSDLINSSDDFDESNIRIYYKNGNAFEYVYKGNLDNPGMYLLDPDENGKLILTVFPSNYYESNQSSTLIELNPNAIDTLVCEFELESNREICKKAWLNGVEMNNRFIQVMK